MLLNQQSHADAIRELIKTIYFSNVTGVRSLNSSPSFDYDSIQSVVNALNLSQPNENFVEAFTRKSELNLFGLRSTNERAAFVGSYLVQYLACREKYWNQNKNFYITHKVFEKLKSIRKFIFPNSLFNLSNDKYLDMAQALIFLEYQSSGIERAGKIFDSFFEIEERSQYLEKLDSFVDGFDYITPLQEELAKLGLPIVEVEYQTLTDKRRSFDPRFCCYLSSGPYSTSGIGGSKRTSRKRASFELLCLVQNHE